MFHQIFKVCIVKPLILFIFKDTTYVFYPKGRKEISVWKIPIITNTQLSRKWTEIGSTLPICRRVGFIKLARDFCTLQRALRGWEKPCRALYGHLQMSWLCAQASLSVLQCLVLTLPSLHTRHPRHSCTSPQDMREMISLHTQSLHYDHFYLMALILGAGQFCCCGYSVGKCKQLPVTGKKHKNKHLKGCWEDLPLKAVSTHPQTFGCSVLWKDEATSPKKEMPEATRENNHRNHQDNILFSQRGSHPFPVISLCVGSMCSSMPGCHPLGSKAGLEKGGSDTLHSSVSAVSYIPCHVFIFLLQKLS